MPYIPELSEQIRTPLDQIEPHMHLDALQIEADYESGRALGFPAKALFGVELDYYFLDFGAAGVPKVAKSYGMTDAEVRERRKLASTAIRQEIARDMAALEPRNRQERERRRDWIRQIPHLTFDEMMMYAGYSFLSKLDIGEYRPDIGQALCQTEDRWDETLEPAFGQALLQTGGYYDNPNSPEKRLVPGTLSRMLARAERATSVFRAIGEYFGYDYLNYGSQMNMSVHADQGDGYKPIHDLATPEGRKVARFAVSGILTAIDAATILRLLADKSRIPKEVEYSLCNAGLTRDHTLRVLPQSFEWRVGSGERESFAGQGVTLLSGFRHGYQHPELATTMGTEESERNWYIPGDRYVKVRDLYLLRALQNADFDSAGIPQLTAPNSLLSNPRAAHVISALCGIPQLPEAFPPDPYDFGPTLNGLLATIRRHSADQITCDPDTYSAWLQTVDHPKLRHLINEAPKETIGADAVTARLRRVKETKAYEVSSQTVPIKISEAALPKILRRFEQAESLDGFSAQTRHALARYIERRPKKQQLHIAALALRRLRGKR